VLIDVVIAGDRNVIKKETHNILKYKNLIIEVRRMWSVKSKVIPAIRGATRTISKSLRQYMSNTLGKCRIYFTGEITLHVAQIVNTEQLQHR
jgi:hypothetical protein